MKLYTTHVDNTGHTFIFIFSLRSFLCKLRWLVFLDWRQSQLLLYQLFHSSCSLWCLMSTARNGFYPHSIITLSRYIWSFTISLYFSKRIKWFLSKYRASHFILTDLLNSCPCSNWGLTVLTPQPLGQEAISFVSCFLCTVLLLSLIYILSILLQL
jgi:hypothetical protein